MADLVYMAESAWTALLDSIRAKGGTSAPMTAAQAKAAVEAIETGGGGYSADEIATRSVSGEIHLSDAVNNEIYNGFANSPITKIYGAKVQRFATSQTFMNCQSLTEVHFPMLTRPSQRAFYGCSSLAVVDCPKIETLGGWDFYGCSSLVKIAFPGMELNGTFTTESFRGCTSLTICDAGVCYNIGQNCFYGDANFATLILRKANGVTTLQNINAFDGTPFASGGSGGTIYIHKVLYDHLGDGSALDYKAATNWSTVDGYGTITWTQIEGSYFETHYGDDTEVSA